MKLIAGMKKTLFISLIFCLFFNCLAQSQQLGNATYYNKKLEGRHTTDGSKYHPDSLTCAHKTYPLGTILKVRNPKNDREVIVKVTDRGPFRRKLMIDLAYCAAKELDIVRYGVALVEITRLDSMPVFRQISSPIILSFNQIKLNIPSLTSPSFPEY